METNNPYKLCLIAIDEDEQFWHTVFQHRLYRGEWYEFSNDGGSCEL